MNRFVELLATTIVGLGWLAGIVLAKGAISTIAAIFIPPEGIRELMIFADRDASYTGQAAAYALAKRLKRDTDLRVWVSLPDNMGDFNDQLLASKGN